MDQLRHQKYKSGNSGHYEMKYLNNFLKNRISNLKQKYMKNFQNLIKILETYNWTEKTKK